MQDNCTKPDWYNANGKGYFKEFLNLCITRQEKISLFLVSGIKLTGYIESVHDDFVLLEKDGITNAIRFEAIATVCY